MPLPDACVLHTLRICAHMCKQHYKGKPHLVVRVAPSTKLEMTKQKIPKRRRHHVHSIHLSFLHWMLLYIYDGNNPKPHVGVCVWRFCGGHSCKSYYIQFFVSVVSDSSQLQRIARKAETQYTRKYHIYLLAECVCAEPNA